MDQGVIANLKLHYRKRLLRESIRKLELNRAPKFDIFEAVTFLDEAWKHDVKGETIRNCFRAAHFIKEEVSHRLFIYNRV